MIQVKLQAKTIIKIPAFIGGGVDLVKAIQLLPGVQAATEGSSGFSVRGETPDQNHILLDLGFTKKNPESKETGF